MLAVRQIIPLIEAEIAKREDQRADYAGRDLDDKPHWRVREHGIASSFVDTGGGVSRSCANARVAQAPLPMPDDGAAVSVSISIRPLARAAESKLLRHWRLQYRLNVHPASYSAYGDSQVKPRR